MPVFFEKMIIPRFRIIARASRGTVLEDLCNRLTIDDGIHHASAMAYEKVLLRDASKKTKDRMIKGASKMLPIFANHVLWRPKERDFVQYLDALARPGPGAARDRRGDQDRVVAGPRRQRHRVHDPLLVEHRRERGRRPSCARLVRRHVRPRRRQCGCDPIQQSGARPTLGRSTAIWARGSPAPDRDGGAAVAIPARTGADRGTSLRRAYVRRCVRVGLLRASFGCMPGLRRRFFSHSCRSRRCSSPCYIGRSDYARERSSARSSRSLGVAMMSGAPLRGTVPLLSVLAGRGQRALLRAKRPSSYGGFRRFTR